MVFGKFDLKAASVANSRFFKRSNIIWRRRKSEDGFVFTTRESIDMSTVNVHKRNETLELYQPAKLLHSLIKACEHLETHHSDAWHLMQTIEIKLLPHLTRSMAVDSITIAEVTADTLKNFNTAAFVKYESFQTDLVSRRQMKEILSS